MSKGGRIAVGALMGVAVGAAFLYAQTDVAVQSIHFDLQRIGESIYEAHAKSGKWPAQVVDLEGTAYLKMPFRKGLLERGVFVVIWHADLDPDPASNKDRLLAYSTGGLLGRFGFIWGCRGDLSIVRIRKEEIAALQVRS